MKQSKLLTRTISGVIYIAIITTCCLLGQWGILGLGCLLGVTAIIEFELLASEDGHPEIPTLLLDMAGVLCLCTGGLLYPLLLWIILLIVRLVEELYIGSATPMRNIGRSLFGQIYIGVPLGLMFAITMLYGSSLLILAIFIMLWLNDTGAYVTGSLLGRNKLFERISPNKTWEGFVGGILFAMIGASVMCHFNTTFNFSDNIWVWLAMSLVVTIFGTWGDLVESMMKRSLGKKDSGNLIPGHGGILDRIDSLLLALPATFVYLVIVILISIPNLLNYIP